ncbi:MAG: hypothetical protein FJ290_23930 [Planctomycetes bacterium]|nr:hypothetical protein [Planctomycetota bacterium]
MGGQVKSGEGTLVGNAGEHYVVAELLKRGVIAALTPRNSPAFDILATRDDRTVRVRVKTKSEQYNDWQWVVKKDGTLFRRLARHDDFTVLVNLTQQTRDLTFYILPTWKLNRWLVKDFDDWLKTPGKKGRRHDPANTKRNLTFPKFQGRLRRHLEAWDSLWR